MPVISGVIGWVCPPVRRAPVAEWMTEGVIVETAIPSVISSPPYSGSAESPEVWIVAPVITQEKVISVVAVVRIVV
jgi:hypothetical protein